MKKTIIALCTAISIFSYNMLIPITVHAQERDCGHHSYTLTYLDPSSVYYISSSHQYLEGNGANGPIYGTCHIKAYHGIRYPQCSICWDVDYSHPQDVYMYAEHENCGLGIQH